MSDDSDSELLASLLSTADNDQELPKKGPSQQSSNAKFSDNLLTVNNNNKKISKDNFAQEDSDDELLSNLLATDDGENLLVTAPSQPEGPNSLKESIPSSLHQFKPNALKELDFNFLDDVSSDFTNDAPKIQSPKLAKKTESIIQNHGDSSDEEDRKYFENPTYSEYGREIKNILKNKESGTGTSTDFKLTFRENGFDRPSSNINTTPKSNSFKSKIASPQSNSFSTLIQKEDKHSLQVQSSPASTVKKDVYSDPVFGLRLIKPLISSAELIEKMHGRKPVTVSGVKLYLSKQSMAGANEDWVIAGVIMNKSAPKTSQKGNQYSIWKITDLSSDMNTVSVFLFSSAYKTHWKLAVGAVVAILNPSVLESRDDKDLATLSVDNALKVMIMGVSRDLGKCKSVKKNGEPCTTPVNLSRCEYCIYHVKQEYGKFSRRSELQTTGSNRAFGVSRAPQSVGVSQQRHPQALPFMAIPAKRNEGQIKRDNQLLAALRGDTKALQKIQPSIQTELKVKAASVDLTSNQVKRDLVRLTKLRAGISDKDAMSPSAFFKEEKKDEPKFSLPAPKLGAGAKGGIIDFSLPTPQNSVNKAKLNALQWVKKNGTFQKKNPNKLRAEKEILREKGIKRRREDEDEKSVEEVVKKEKAVQNRFQKMLAMTSAHSDLVEKRQDEEAEQYFRKLEVKERMEEKMLTTYKVDCKAVRCSVCKYIAFSSSDMCKKLQHPIKVIDAVKRFFKCGDCGNRTICLDRIPTETCKRCSSSKWIKTAMMDEKRTEIPGSKLCIRGGEETFIGSTVTDASLNLLVPDPD